MPQPLLLKSPLASAVKTACSVLTLTACLTIGSAQAADQGSRHHAKGQYDTVTATYAVSYTHLDVYKRQKLPRPTYLVL